MYPIKYYALWIKHKIKIINPPNCTILDSWVFQSFILTDRPFSRDWQIFETCVLVNNNLWGKLVSSLDSQTAFEERFRVTSVPSSINDYNLLSCKLNNFTFKSLYWVMLY